MNIAPIQLPPQLPPQTPNPVINPVCPKAPQKNLHLSWAHAVNSQVCRKLVFDKVENTTEKDQDNNK